MENNDDLNFRLLKSWIGAYKILVGNIHDVNLEYWPEVLEWNERAEHLRLALFTSMDEDTQTILTRLWESVVI